MKTKLKIVMSFLTVIMLLLIVGCGGKEETTNEKIDSEQTKDSVFEIKLGSAVNEWTELYAPAVPTFKELVEENSDGRIKVVLYPDAQLGGEREITEQLQTGTLDMAMVSAAVFSNFQPGVTYLDVPYFITDFQDALTTLDGPLGKKAEDLMLERGVRILKWQLGNFRQISNDIRPIRVPSDLKGITMRSAESNYVVNWLSSIGTNPVPVPNQEIYQALQHGMVSGHDVGPELSLLQNFSDHTRYVTITNHVYLPITYSVSEKMWSNLPEDLQQVVIAALDTAVAMGNENIINKEAEHIKKLEEKGIEVIQLTDQELEQWIETAKPHYESVKDLVDEETYQLLIEKLGID